MTTNIKPLHDRVIVIRIAEGEQVRGGIIIPDTAKEKPQEGEVIAVGEGKYGKDGKRQALDVKAGDRVLFGKYSSSEVRIDGEELLIMREDEILGIISRAGAAAGSAGGGSTAAPAGALIQDLLRGREKDYGKANSSRRRVARGDFARRQPAGRR